MPDMQCRSADIGGISRFHISDAYIDCLAYCDYIHISDASIDIHIPDAYIDCLAYYNYIHISDEYIDSLAYCNYIHISDAYVDCLAFTM